MTEKYPRNIYDRADIGICIQNKTQWQLTHFEIIGFSVEKNALQTS